MGTTTTVTCDTCGADITDATQVQVTVSYTKNIPAPPPEEPIEGKPPVPSFPTIESNSSQAVYCEEHGPAVIKKAEKLIPTTQEAT